MRKNIGIALIYSAALLIMFSIISLFEVIKWNYAYTTAAFGFILYIGGLFLTREGRFSIYKIFMLIIAVILVFMALVREIFRF
ncbi:MAG: hypothetical protein DRP54_06635 [Spirochaetes bacterium]|nr:MAG: hypothetical protein DRP54_06635 [Spirochaetota bacterium]